MKKCINFLCFFTLFHTSLLFAIVDEGRVGNGSGEAERNIVYAMGTMDQTLTHLLSTHDVFSSEELSILNKIARNLAPLEQRLKQVRFKSERENPGFFIIDGQLKVAKTWTESDAPIYFNVDLLYKRNPSGEALPYTITKATSLLIHELGHQTGTDQCALLDRMATKAELELHENGQELTIPYKNNTISINAYSLYDTLKNKQTKLTIATTDDFLDLTPYLYKKIKCPSEKKSIMTSLALENLHRAIDFKSVSEAGEWRMTQPIIAWARLRCADETKASFVTYQQIELHLTIYQQEGKRLIDKTNMTINQSSL